jgi:nucleotide-binding universal stress UspA family protein
MKTLLAVVNEPEDSREYVAYALNLAKGLQLNLHLLYIQNPANNPFGEPGLTGIASIQIEATLEDLAVKAKKTLTSYVEEYFPGEVSTRISSETGILQPLIEELVADGKTDMVLLENVDQVIFWTQNSTTMGIIRNIKCPVWVVPRKNVYHPFRNILYATEYHEEDVTTLKKLIELTRQFSPDITALHVTDSDDFEFRIKETGFQEMVRKKTSYERVSIKSLVEKSGDDMGQLINDYAALIHADLIVVLKENRNFLERLFKSSVTREIIEKAGIPVLVYHEQTA